MVKFSDNTNFFRKGEIKADSEEIPKDLSELAQFKSAKSGQIRGSLTCKAALMFLLYSQAYFCICKKKLAYRRIKHQLLIINSTLQVPSQLDITNVWETWVWGLLCFSFNVYLIPKCIIKYYRAQEYRLWL